MYQRLAALLLISVIGLTGCTNIIHATTDEPIKPDPTNTSLGTDIDDWQLETLIGVNIKKASSQLEHAHVNINAYNGVILLTGEVASNDLRTLAGNTARDFRGVRQVHNELQVTGTSSLVSRSNDVWLSTKVRSKLIAEKNIKSTRIKVVTESGVIYLMGLVTRSTGDQAALVASTTRGAKRVVKVFEYID
ncbi:BON domain-containing protein [Porticoccus litoralis]|uniref:BON domain-containing protein n=1 Tax=Porticoccus litoralis TaxID=434086 RepID=A0AAW8B025_9GAMM|nr:BON domain-containing protein [Porticoccus litoralis]MDP1520050.1 BON domain-containing protein [Porticoccus litoralis]TNE90011.1 MAG: BON domain-containing protein [Gammaproteobacteria bacterium]